MFAKVISAMNKDPGFLGPALAVSTQITHKGFLPVGPRMTVFDLNIFHLTDSYRSGSPVVCCNNSKDHEKDMFIVQLILMVFV